MYTTTRNIYLLIFFRNFVNLLFKFFLQIERREKNYFDRKKKHLKFKNNIKTINKTIDVRREISNKMNQSKN